MKLVYAEAHDGTGVVRLFVDPTAPLHLRQRGLLLKHKIEVLQKQQQDVDFTFRKQKGKKIPPGQNIVDFTQ